MQALQENLAVVLVQQESKGHRMKKLALILLIFFFASAQSMKFTEFRFGTFNPVGTKAGFYGTVSTGKMFDANLGYNVEVGYFGKRYTGRTKIGNVGTNNSSGYTYREDFTTSTTMIPIILKFNYVSELNSKLLYKWDIGLGYAFFWDSYENPTDNIVDETRFFSGFLFQAGADIGLQISAKGSIYAGLFYNNSTVTGNNDVKAGLPVYDEIDLSGLGLRLTIRLDGVGFDLF
jgi:hypothetical protein